MLVEYQLLSSTSRRVVERNLLSMRDQTLVRSPVGGGGGANKARQKTNIAQLECGD